MLGMQRELNENNTQIHDLRPDPLAHRNEF